MRRLFLIVLSVFSLSGFLGAQQIINLYPEGKMPNVNNVVVQDSLSNARYYSIAQPRIAVYETASEENSGTAVLIIPGGGYHHITHQTAGIQMAKWFNTMGINAFVLYYRLPNQPNLVNPAIAPLQDAQRAIQIIRANALEWGVKPGSIGVMGSSAGGHLAALAGTQTTNITALSDSISAYDFSVDFMILVSPVISMGKITHKGSKENLLGKKPTDELIAKYSCENRVNSETSPAFIVHATDDKSVPSANSVVFYEALKKFNNPSTLHIFSQGGHNIALRNNPGATDSWTTLCEAWLKENRLLKSEE